MESEKKRGDHVQFKNKSTINQKITNQLKTTKINKTKKQPTMGVEITQPNTHTHTHTHTHMKTKESG